jgi:hypothetical protein
MRTVEDECIEAANHAVRDVVEFLRTKAPYYAELVEKEFLSIPEPKPVGVFSELDWPAVDDGEFGRTRG